MPKSFEKYRKDKRNRHKQFIPCVAHESDSDYEPFKKEKNSLKLRKKGEELTLRLKQPNLQENTSIFFDRHTKEVNEDFQIILYEKIAKILFGREKLDLQMLKAAERDVYKVKRQLKRQKRNLKKAKPNSQN